MGLVQFGKSAPDHHPVNGSEFKLLVGVDDKRDALSAAVYRGYEDGPNSGKPYLLE
jgi:hypothetical protein